MPLRPSLLLYVNNFGSGLCIYCIYSEHGCVFLGFLLKFCTMVLFFTFV